MVQRVGIFKSRSSILAKRKPVKKKVVMGRPLLDKSGRQRAHVTFTMPADLLDEVDSFVAASDLVSTRSAFFVGAISDFLADTKPF